MARFKPGQIANPNGRPVDPPELKALKKLNRTEFEKMVNEVLALTREDLIELTKTPGVPGVKLALASILIKSIKDGDHHRMDFFINRLLGRVPEKFESANGEPLSFVALVKLARDKSE